MFRNFFIRLGGHDPRTISETDGREATAPIVFMGETVALCAMVAAANWAVAVHSYAANGAGGYVWLAAFGGALLGFGFVTIIDKFAIHCLDCLTLGWIRTLGYFGIRAVIISLVSAVTTEAVAPWLLQNDLTAHAYHMIEQSNDQRLRGLRDTYLVEPLRAAVTQGGTDVRDARHALQTVPADVVALQKETQVCWRAYANSRATLLRAGLSNSVARERLNPQATKCVAASTAARQALASHIERSRTLLAEAEAEQRAAKVRLDQTQSRIDTQITEAHDVEKRALTPNSAVVLASLLASDWGSWWRYQSFRALLVAIELLPLMLMMIGKRSVSGVRVGVDREIAIAKHERLLEAILDEHYSEAAVRTMMTGAMQGALASPAVHQHAMQHFQAKIDVLLPIDIAKRVVSELEASALIVETAARKHPSIARAATEVWTRAMAEVAAALRQGPVPAT